MSWHSGENEAPSITVVLLFRVAGFCQRERQIYIEKSRKRNKIITKFWRSDGLCELIGKESCINSKLKTCLANCKEELARHHSGKFAPFREAELTKTIERFRSLVKKLKTIANEKMMLKLILIIMPFQNLKQTFERNCSPLYQTGRWSSSIFSKIRLMKLVLVSLRIYRTSYYKAQAKMAK